MVGTSRFLLSVSKEKALFIFTGRSSLSMEERLERIKEAYPFIETFIFMDQVHGSRVVWIEEKPSEPKIIRDCDGVISTVPGIALCVKTADCLPVLFSSLDGSIRGALHCGWRGLEKSIIGKALQMLEVGGFNPREMLFVIGPGICGSCYEVGSSFKKLSIGRFARFEGGKLHLPLRRVVKERLSERGILEENIKVLPFCTYENPDIFFSHRRGDRERQVSIVVNLP